MYKKVLLIGTLLLMIALTTGCVPQNCKVLSNEEAIVIPKYANTEGWYIQYGSNRVNFEDWDTINNKVIQFADNDNVYVVVNGLKTQINVCAPESSGAIIMPVIR